MPEPSLIQGNNLLDKEEMKKRDVNITRRLAKISLVCLLGSLPLSIIVYTACEETESWYLAPITIVLGWSWNISPWFILPRGLFLFGIWCGLRTLYLSHRPLSRIELAASILGAILALLIIVVKICE